MMHRSKYPHKSEAWNAGFIDAVTKLRYNEHSKDWSAHDASDYAFGYEQGVTELRHDAEVPD